jgi:transketolase
LALENHHGPTALLLSRQAIPEIKARPGSTRYQDALQIARGAYIVQATEGRPDLVLVANGSEVATLLGGAELLSKHNGLKVQVVSAPSEALFREQDAAYQDSVLPVNIPVLGMTAGLPLSLRGLVGPLGKVFGLERFGASAPFKVLDEKFGFTADNVAKQAGLYLAEYQALKAKII